MIPRHPIVAGIAIIVALVSAGPATAQEATREQKRAEFIRACQAMVPDEWKEPKWRAEWFVACEYRAKAMERGWQ